jgi:predicted ATPase
VPAYILTGAPGSGKTTVEEPWREPGFIEEIIALQQRRQDLGGCRPPAAASAGSMMT